MSRARLFALVPVAIVLVAGGCGSASRATPGASGGTAVPPKLELAESGRSSAAAAADAGPAIYPQRPARYVLDGALPDLGATAPVWRMQSHAVTEADVARFAGAVGLTATPTRTSTGWEVQGTDAILSVLVGDGVVIVSYSPGAPGASGGSTGSGAGATPGGPVVNGPDKVAPVPPPVSPPASTVVPLPTIAPTPAPVDVPSAADATTIARALLDRAGVTIGTAWSATVNDSGGVVASSAAGLPCPALPPEVSARTVTFSLTLDGHEVDGVNWSVTVGEHRRLESVYGQWADPVAIGSYPLRSTAAVFADLQHGTAKYGGPQPMTAFAAPSIELPAVDTGSSGRSTTTAPAAVIVHVSDVALGLAAWTAYDHGNAVTDLVPTYRFRARVDNGDPYDIVVLALDPSAATFTEPGPSSSTIPRSPTPDTTNTAETAVAPAAP